MAEDHPSADSEDEGEPVPPVPPQHLSPQVHQPVLVPPPVPLNQLHDSEDEGEPVPPPPVPPQVPPHVPPQVPPQVPQQIPSPVPLNQLDGTEPCEILNGGNSLKVIPYEAKVCSWVNPYGQVLHVLDRKWRSQMLKGGIHILFPKLDLPGADVSDHYFRPTPSISPTEVNLVYPRYQTETPQLLEVNVSFSLNRDGSVTIAYRVTNNDAIPHKFQLVVRFYLKCNNRKNLKWSKGLGPGENNLVFPLSDQAPGQEIKADSCTVIDGSRRIYIQKGGFFTRLYAWSNRFSSFTAEDHKYLTKFLILDFGLLLRPVELDPGKFTKGEINVRAEVN